MMIRPSFKSGLWLALLVAAPAGAQELVLSGDPMVQARAAEARRDPAEALARYLRVLSSRPKDLEALTGAGRAALDIGDPSAAIGFYARAEEISPRNGHIKAGLGSAMLQMENAKAALRLFDEAVDRGVPPGEVASDRGLAYDLRGDNRRAQQEYALALRTKDDAETRRRLALSLAMTGDRPGALNAIDPLLRRQDIPAWRTRAFVLALTGDAAGAEKSALAVMPVNQATALLPFLARLSMLKPQQQAAAVHFGHFPSDGRRVDSNVALADAAAVQNAARARTGSALGRGDDGASVGSEARAAPPERLSTAPRRRPGASEDRLASVMAGVLGAPAASAAPPPNAAASTPAVAPPTPAPGQLVLRPSPAAASPRIEAGVASLPESSPTGRLAQAEPARKVAPKPAAPRSESAAKKTEPAPAPKEPKPKEKVAEKAKDAKTADTKAKDGTKAKEAEKAKEAKEAKAKTSERYWVQIAGGANKADLPKAFSKLKEKSPKLLAGRSAWTTPLRATNRLLVGPFKTAEEAQGFVNQASRESLSAFTYTSPPDQKVEKLSAK